MHELITVYIDYKSPYAYLAIEPTLQLEKDFLIAIEWLPYTLDIPDFLGSATVDQQGNVIEQNRSEHQWRRVRYSYMDARRYANLMGLTVRGPQKIWDSTLANLGLLFATDQGKAELYTDMIFKQFWRRELDIENPEIITAVLKEAKVNTETFQDFIRDKGPTLHKAIREKAEAIGVFGVPMYILDGELFWGREHLPLIRQRLTDKGLARLDLDAKSHGNEPNAASHVT